MTYNINPKPSESLMELIYDSKYNNIANEIASFIPLKQIKHSKYISGVFHTTNSFYNL